MHILWEFYSQSVCACEHCEEAWVGVWYAHVLTFSNLVPPTWERVHPCAWTAMLWAQWRPPCSSQKGWMCQAWLGFVWSRRSCFQNSFYTCDYHWWPIEWSARHVGLHSDSLRWYFCSPRKYLPVPPNNRPLAVHCSITLVGINYSSGTFPWERFSALELTMHLWCFRPVLTSDGCLLSEGAASSPLICTFPVATDLMLSFCWPELLSFEAWFLRHEHGCFLVVDKAKQKRCTGREVLFSLSGI